MRAGAAPSSARATGLSSSLLQPLLSKRQYSRWMRIGTWNALSGQSVAPTTAATFADVIASFGLDLLALNEVDQYWARSGYSDQPRVAAEAMGAGDWRFAPSFRGDDRQRTPTPGRLLGPQDRPGEAHYGIALLSRVPVLRWERMELGASAIGLPLLNARDGARQLQYVPDEPHQALAAHLSNGWTVIATHLSFVTPLGFMQLRRLQRWARGFGERVVVMGDMNLPGSILPRRPGWRSAVRMATYPSWNPRVQFDHILLRDSVGATPIPLNSMGISDHLPLAASLL